MRYYEHTVRGLLDASGRPPSDLLVRYVSARLDDIRSAAQRAKVEAEDVLAALDEMSIDLAELDEIPETKAPSGRTWARAIAPGREAGASGPMGSQWEKMIDAASRVEALIQGYNIGIIALMPPAEDEESE